MSIRHSIKFPRIRTELVMGKGSVITGVAVDPASKSFGALVFKSVIEPGTPGQKVESCPDFKKVSDADLIIEFTTPESVDQMIENLNTIKAYLGK